MLNADVPAWLSAPLWPLQQLLLPLPKLCWPRAWHWPSLALPVKFSAALLWNTSSTPCARSSTTGTLRPSPLSCWACWGGFHHPSIFLQGHPGPEKSSKHLWKRKRRGRNQQREKGKPFPGHWICNLTLAASCHQQHQLQAASIQQLLPKINSAGFPGCLLGFALNVFSSCFFWLIGICDVSSK